MAKKNPTFNEKMLEALKTEKKGYVARELEDRVKEVDAEIARVTKLVAAQR